jgi:hypothetical protein
MESPNRSDGFTTNVGSHANGFGGLPAARHAIENEPHRSHTNTPEQGFIDLSRCMSQRMSIPSGSDQYEYRYQPGCTSHPS